MRRHVDDERDEGDPLADLRPADVVEAARDDRRHPDQHDVRHQDAQDVAAASELVSQQQRRGPGGGDRGDRPDDQVEDQRDPQHVRQDARRDLRRLAGDARRHGGRQADAQEAQDRGRPPGHVVEAHRVLVEQRGDHHHVDAVEQHPRDACGPHVRAVADDLPAAGLMHGAPVRVAGEVPAYHPEAEQHTGGVADGVARDGADHARARQQQHHHGRELHEGLHDGQQRQVAAVLDRLDDAADPREEERAQQRERCRLDGPGVVPVDHPADDGCQPQHQHQGTGGQHRPQPQARGDHLADALAPVVGLGDVPARGRVDAHRGQHRRERRDGHRERVLAVLAEAQRAAQHDGEDARGQGTHDA